MDTEGSRLTAVASFGSLASSVNAAESTDASAACSAAAAGDRPNDASDPNDVSSSYSSDRATDALRGAGEETTRDGSGPGASSAQKASSSDSAADAGAMGLGGTLASSSSAPAAPYLSFILLGSGSRSKSSSAPSTPTVAAKALVSTSSSSSATSISSSCAGGASREGTSRGGETEGDSFVVSFVGGHLWTVSDPPLAPGLLPNESEAPRACFADAGDDAGLYGVAAALAAAETAVSNFDAKATRARSASVSRVSVSSSLAASAALALSSCLILSAMPSTSSSETARDKAAALLSISAFSLSNAARSDSNSARSSRSRRSRSSRRVSASRAARAAARAFSVRALSRTQERPSRSVMLGRRSGSLVRALWMTNARSGLTVSGRLGAGALTIFDASASWFFASKGGLPTSSSCARHPNAHTSLLSLYGFSCASSGEKYRGVPTPVLAKSECAPSTRPRPKSPITTRSSASPSARLKMFAGLRSLCRMRSECRCFKPRATGRMYLQTSSSGNAPPLAFITRDRSSPACSMTMYRQSLSGSSHESMYATTCFDWALRRMEASFRVSALSWSLRPPNETCFSTHFISSDRRVQSYTRPYVCGFGVGAVRRGKSEISGESRGSTVTGGERSPETHPGAYARVDRVGLHGLLRCATHGVAGAARNGRGSRQNFKSRGKVRATAEVSQLRSNDASRCFEQRPGDGESVVIQKMDSQSRSRARLPSRSATPVRLPRPRVTYAQSLHHLLRLLVEDVPLEPQVQPRGLTVFARRDAV